MSVTYYLSKRIRVKDLKEKNYQIIDNRGNEGQYPIVIKKGDSDSWLGVDSHHCRISDNIDDTEFYRLEGHMFIGGIGIMFQIADDFNLKFMDDEEFEYLYFREKHDFTKEDEDKLFNERCDEYMNNMLEKFKNNE